MNHGNRRLPRQTLGKRQQWLARVLIGLLGGVCAVGGCGKEKPIDRSTPENAWKAFDALMQQGKAVEAAKLLAYDQLAIQENPDWNTFPVSQRKLIKDKMQEAWESTLQRWAYPSGGCPIQQAQTQGTQAALIVGTGNQRFQVQMIQTEEGWKISGGLPVQVAL